MSCGGRFKNKEVTDVQSLPLISDFVIVGIADEISNIKFIEDFDKIVNFMLATVHA
jgi:hypothetical protein